MDGKYLCTSLPRLATDVEVLGWGWEAQIRLLGLPEREEDREQAEAALGRWAPAGMT